VIIFPHVIFDPTEPYNWRQAELYERRREVNPKTAVCPLAPPQKEKHQNFANYEESNENGHHQGTIGSTHQ
jgi:hypothetical protein